MKIFKKLYKSGTQKEKRKNSLWGFLFFFFMMLPLLIHSSFAQTREGTIKIGFLIRDKGDLHSIRIATLAIDDANRKGGHHGRKFELVVRSCDGPWGVGSKQAVAMVHDDGVSLIVGALDGRNAHLAEQVAAKSHVVLLSTLSSDPTLSRAYVPWYFRLVPDDKQQAQALIEQIYLKDHARNVALVAFDNYDGKMSVETFEKLAINSGFVAPIKFVNLKENELLEKLHSKNWDAVILAGSAANISDISKSIRFGKIYGFLNIFNFPEDYIHIPDIRFVVPVGFNISGFKSLIQRSNDEYGMIPSISAAYIYDGITLACEAVKEFGTNPEALRANFSKMRKKGITGNIKFGKLGDRSIDLLFENPFKE